MKLLRVGAFLMLAGAAAACTKDTAGTVVVLDSLAGLRYMNFVADTTAVDFRIVDVVSYAPAQVSATFRSGGFLNGISTGGLTPVYAPVAAGTRHIRVFLNGGSPAVSSTILLDTNFTFASNTNYSFYLYGYAKAANGTPALNALIVQDTAPTLSATQFGLRVLNLAPTLSGNPAGSAATAVDGAVGLTTTGVPVGATSFTNLAVGGRSAYLPIAVTTAGQVLRLALTGTGTTSPIVFQSPLPVGAAGTAIVQPVPGTAVAGTVITAVLVPRSVAGSGAPQTTPAAATTIDSVFRSNDTVTVVRGLVAGNGSTTCPTAIAAGAAANDIINLSGLAQPEYNGAQAVISVTAGTNGGTPAPACSTPTAIRSRFRFRIAGTPVSPATGTPTFKLVTSSTADFSSPNVLFMFDVLPARTAP